MQKDLTFDKRTKPLSFFRFIVKNGNSTGINLTSVLKDFEVVKVTVIKQTKHTVTIKLEDTRYL